MADTYFDYFINFNFQNEQGEVFQKGISISCDNVESLKKHKLFYKTLNDDVDLEKLDYNKLTLSDGGKNFEDFKFNKDTTFHDVFMYVVEKCELNPEPPIRLYLDVKGFTLRGFRIGLAVIDEGGELARFGIQNVRKRDLNKEYIKINGSSQFNKNYEKIAKCNEKGEIIEGSEIDITSLKNFTFYNAFDKLYGIQNIKKGDGNYYGLALIAEKDQKDT